MLVASPDASFLGHFCEATRPIDYHHHRSFNLSKQRRGEARVKDSRKPMFENFVANLFGFKIYLSSNNFVRFVLNPKCQVGPSLTL
jgi:hypothetical protein